MAEKEEKTGEPCGHCRSECDKMEEPIKFYFDMYESIILGQQT